jgi:hypothetical protein
VIVRFHDDKLFWFGINLVKRNVPEGRNLQGFPSTHKVNKGVCTLALL